MTTPTNHLRPRRQWTVHLIHHTHTDVGFTDSQRTIARFHAEFLDQAIALARRAADPAGDAALRGFRWTNECFWSIEQWLARNPPERHPELLDALRSGGIALTGTYLHYTELPDADLLRSALSRARAFCDRHGLPLDTALSADVNGFGWHYASALLDAGIQNLVTCVHSHHGLAPIGRRQMPFFWQTHDGRELLVWNGEHYNLGNALGLAPGAVITYDFADELRPATRTADILPLALKRLPRYLRQLEDDGYPYDFVPLHVSGAMTDNAPPSEGVIRFVHRWNAADSGSITLRMGSPAELCQAVRVSSVPIPRHRGDWPDWWSDGPASTPAEVRLARAAARTRRWLGHLAERSGAPAPGSNESACLQRAEQKLLLFTEHTFSHSDSVCAPWDINVKGIGGGKRALACAAWEAAVEARHAALARLGALANLAPHEAGDRFFYKVINPLSVEVTDVARLYLESKDFDLLPLNPRVIDTRTGEPLPCRVSRAPRGITCDVVLTVVPGEEVVLELRTGTGALRSLARNVTERGLPDDIADDHTHATAVSGVRCVETSFLRIDFDETAGITGWIDKTSGAELLAPNRVHPPFCPVYDVTSVAGQAGEDMTCARSRFGRNRKGPGARRSVGTLSSIEFNSVTDNWIPVTLHYSVEGVVWWRVRLDIWRTEPRVDVTLRLHKTSVWEPENLYASLPFAPSGNQLWLDKPGAPVRPWIDQLPDTLTDWSCIQEGFCSSPLESEAGNPGTAPGLAVSMPDSPLLQLGPLGYGPRRVMGNPDLTTDTPLPYAWLMTNFWETNFDASLAGFHEFNFRVESGTHLSTPVAALARVHALNHGLTAFRIPVPVGS